jgi:hypothetical protein
MFGNRKRFLRVENRIINLDQVCMMEYEEMKKQIHFYFTDENKFALWEMEQADFERLASALKYGRVKA